MTKSLEEENGISPFLRIHIDPPIVGKARPRFNRRGRVYTPKKTKDFEEKVSQLTLIALHAANRIGPTQLPVLIFGTIIHPIPKSIKNVPDGGWVAKGGHLYPDIDNVIKACLDGMNKIAYLDDSQVCGLRFTRCYAAEGEHPGIYLELYTIG